MSSAIELYAQAIVFEWSCLNRYHINFIMGKSIFHINKYDTTNTQLLCICTYVHTTHVLNYNVFVCSYWRSLTVRNCNTDEDMVVIVIHPQELTKVLSAIHLYVSYAHRYLIVNIYVRLVCSLKCIELHPVICVIFFDTLKLV